MNTNALVPALVLCVLGSGCGGHADPELAPAPAAPSSPSPSPAPAAPSASAFDTVLIVLGNEPLDDETPTVDTIARVEKAVAYRKENPGALLVFTGGPTAGNTSEARMMADLALARGVPADSIRLEEKARSTAQNARLSAALVREVAPRRVFIVSKSDHLDWAMPIFKRVAEFADAEPLGCQVDRAASIAQMEAYLRRRDSARVRSRLEALKKGVRGVD